MICEADVAVLATGHPSARMTLYHGRKATAVLKENDLLFLFQRLAYILQQQGREGAVHALFMLQFLDVDGNNLGQLDFLVPFLQFHQGIFTGGGIVPALDGRRSSTQQSLGIIHGSQYNGGVAGMVTGAGSCCL